MTSELLQSQSRLAVVHAFVYAAGLILLVAGFFGHAPILLLLSGPCLAMSGALIWVGTHHTLAGPVGAMLSRLLGRSRVASMHLRAAFWVLVGVLVTIWGATMLRTPPDQLHSPQDPLIGVLTLSPATPWASSHASAGTMPLARRDSPSGPSRRAA